MILRDIQPHPALGEFIRCYRLVHFEFSPVDPIPVKAYPPKPEQCLHFFLYDFFAVQKSNGPVREQPAILLAGQRTFVANQYNGRHFLDVQIVFQPMAIFQLTGIPADQLTDQHVDAALIFGPGIDETLQRLRQAKNYQELVDLIEEFAFGLARHVRNECAGLSSVGRKMLQVCPPGLVEYSTSMWVL